MHERLLAGVEHAAAPAIRRRPVLESEPDQPHAAGIGIAVGGDVEVPSPVEPILRGSAHHGAEPHGAEHHRLEDIRVAVDRSEGFGDPGVDIGGQAAG